MDRKKFSFKKKFCVVLAVLIVLGAACLSAMFFLKTDYSEAREKAIEYAGPDSQIVSEESEAEFLFFNEYSFGVISGNEYYEIDINAFGIITSVERSKLSV